jgi:hypothetical protein
MREKYGLNELGGIKDEFAVVNHDEKNDTRQQDHATLRK